jgi:D-amino-acid dehydrogenase
MAQHASIIGGGVIGLATAYALVRDGFDVTLIEARDALGSETSFANGGQLSYRYVAPLADAGVPLQAIGWMLRGDSPLKLRPRFDPAQWRWMAAFLAACRSSVNRANAGHLLRLALLSQATLQAWREEDGLEGFHWRRNGKLVTFRQASSFDHARKNRCCRTQTAPASTRPWRRRPSLAPSIPRMKKWVIATLFASNWPRACGRRGVANSAWARP